MKDEIDSLVDDLLARWHRWRSGYSHGAGYSSTSAMFRDAPAGWSAYGRDEDAETTIEDTIMEGVESAVMRIPNEPHPWRTCIEFEARNLCSRAEVWRSQRLPGGESLAVLRVEARSKLMLELHVDGIVGC